MSIRLKLSKSFMSRPWLNTLHYKQKFQHKTELFLSGKSSIFARVRRILSYRTRNLATGSPLLGITRHKPINYGEPSSCINGANAERDSSTTPGVHFVRRMRPTTWSQGRRRTRLLAEERGKRTGRVAEHKVQEVLGSARG